MNDSSGEETIADVHRVALAALRRQAMAWVERLGPGAKGDAEGDVKKLPDGAIAKNDGLIDAFNIAAQIVLRVIDKEREAHGLAAASDFPQPSDEQELERLISAELDRIAAATGKATLGEADGAELEAADPAALGLEDVERPARAAAA